jgi:hypothetical protein
MIGIIMASVQLNDSDILDEFNNGRWLLLNVGDKSNMICDGNHIQVRDRKALVDEMIFGHRNNRLALLVTYVSEDGDENVATSPVLAAQKFVAGQHVDQTPIEGCEWRISE